MDYDVKQQMHTSFFAVILLLKHTFVGGGFRGLSHTHTFIITENSVGCRSQCCVWPRLHTPSSLPCSIFIADTQTQRRTLWSECFWMSCMSASSHDGALICCSGSCPTGEKKWLHVKVEPWRLKRKRETIVFTNIQINLTIPSTHYQN